MQQRYFSYYDGLSALSQKMNVPEASVASHTIAGLTFPSAMSTYRLYPGGKSYTIPQLPATIQGSAYQADPATNPAGIFFRNGTLNINANTTIRGTIIAASGGRPNLSQRPRD